MPATLFKNARLLDPWTHLDQAGDLLSMARSARSAPMPPPPPPPMRSSSTARAIAWRPA